MISCPTCGSRDVRRCARRGLADLIRSWFDLWPYRCDRCRKKFSSKQRRNPNDQRAGESLARAAERRFQTTEQQPVAHVTIQAESHEQLQHMLLTLNRVVDSYSRGPRARQNSVQ